MVSSIVNKIPAGETDTNKRINKALLYFLKSSEKNSELINRIPANKIFMIKHEDFIANPKRMMADMCDFLDVAKPSDYLSDCAAATYKIPNKSRYKIDWNKRMLKRIRIMVEKYEFLNGYSLDT